MGGYFRRWRMGITTEPREKGNAGELVLPKVAIDIINTLPKFESNPYVFAGRSCRAFSVTPRTPNATLMPRSKMSSLGPFTIFAGLRAH